MRLDRLREGLLGGPLLPGGVFDARPLPHTGGPRAENVMEAIGNPEAQENLRMFQNLSRRRGEAPIDLTHLQTMSQLAGALRGDDVLPSRADPPSKEGLGELSDIIQGKAMGQMVPESPLQDMQPVDPSYGDLFKKLRPY